MKTQRRTSVRPAESSLFSHDPSCLMTHLGHHSATDIAHYDYTPDLVLRRVRIYAHLVAMNGDPTRLVAMASQNYALMVQRGC